MYITPSERQKIILDRIRSCSVRQNEGEGNGNNIPTLSSKKTDVTDTTPIVMNINKVYGGGFTGDESYDYDMFVQPTQQGSFIVETPEELFEVEKPDAAIETSLLSDDTVLIAPAQQNLHASLISTDDEDSVDEDNKKINLDESLLSDYYYEDNYNDNDDDRATQREFAGATVAGTLLGLVLGGPLGAVAVGASSAFIVNRRNNDAAKIVRKGGESIANLGDRVYKHSPTARASVHTGQKTISEARKVLEKHKILQRLQEMDDKHQIRQRAFCGCVGYDPTTDNNGRYFHSHGGGGATSPSDKCANKTAKRTSSRLRRSRSNSKSSRKSTSTSTGSDVGGGSTSMMTHNHNHRENNNYAESTATINADDFEETYTIQDYIPSVDDDNKENNNNNTNQQEEDEDEDDEVVKFDTDPLTGKRLLPLPSMWNQKNYQRVYI